MAASLTREEVFAGRYRLLRALGQGGMAEVWLAHDTQLDRDVALKILNDGYGAAPDFVERFQREAAAAAKFSHPNIVSIFDRGEADGRHYISMEAIGGQPLAELLRAEGTLPLEDAVAVTRQLLAAAGYAHRHGVVHRDLKPQNIVLTEEGVARVVDFGIARFGDAHLTEDGTTLGTATYLSPEQARGEPAGPAADLYSIGVILYELLAGRPPFQGDSPLAVVAQHRDAPPPPPTRFRGDIPPALEAVVMRALAKSPNERYRSAEDFDRELARALPAPVTVETAVGAPPPGAAYAPRAPRFWPWLLALGLLVLVGVGAAYVLTQREDTRSEPPPPQPTAVGRQVPSVVGLSARAAVRRLTRAGFRARIQRRTSRLRSGTVLRQRPVAGRRLSPGRPVTLVVARPATIAVPNVKGVSAATAFRRIQAADLRPRARRIFAAQPVGEIVAQQPAAGERAREGATVLLRVSKGPRPIPVPTLIGQRETEAAQRLTSLGLEPDVFRVPAQEAAGTVVGQSPPAGKRIRRGKAVRINVSDGPPDRVRTAPAGTGTRPTPPATAPQPRPARRTTVPDVVGQTEARAAARLAAAGLRADSFGVPSSEPRGTVVSQAPAGGATVRRGSAVRLNISLGTAQRPLRTVPDVVGEDEETARTRLRQAGFTVRTIDQETVDPAEEGTVLDQDPAGGARRRTGSQIVIYVGRLSQSE